MFDQNTPIGLQFSLKTRWKIRRNIMPTGAELFVQTIQQFGIERLFTLVGDHLNAVLSAAAKAGIEIIAMRHEAAVVHAADAYARITRQPALSLVTGGPGHTNSLTGLATAYLACSPVIAVSGSRPNSSADRQAFQDIDQLGMAKPVVKWAAQPFLPAQIPFYLARAFSEASAGRKGPAHLSIPVDVFIANTDAPAPYSRATPSPSCPNPNDVSRALKLLRRAERPIVLCGGGVWWADAAAELHKWIERESLPVFTVSMARGLVSDDHPLCFGYADPALSRSSHAAFQAADLVLILGKRIDFRLGLGSSRVLPPSATYIQVDVHAQELGMNRELNVAIQADVKQTLKAFLASDSIGKLRTVWLDRLAVLRDEWRQTLHQHAIDRGRPLHPIAFFAEMIRLLPPDTLFSWDGGDFTHWGRTLTPARVAGGWLRLGPLATIGAALPNGIALKLANPDKPVAVITGDGALGFYIAEVETAVRLNLPLILIIGNDSGWGLERELQSAVEGTNTACELRSTRYDRVIEAFGGAGESIDSIEQIEPAIQRALRSPVPYCLNVLIRGVRSPFTEWSLQGKGKPAR